MRQRVKIFVKAAEAFVLSPFLPAAALMVIALFTVSLAVAEPRGDTQVFAARVTPTFSPLSEQKTLASDSITDEEAALFSAPLAAPHYHDRYRFYHRYDRYTPPSRLRTLSNGRRLAAP